MAMYRALLWAPGKPEEPKELKAGSKAGTQAAGAKRNGKDRVPPV